MTNASSADPDDVRLRALPVRLLHTDRGVIIKRSRTELLITGEGAGPAVQQILEVASDGATRNEMARLFPASARAVVLELVDRLGERRLVVPEDDLAGAREPEEAIDIFYWELGRRPEEVTGDLAQTSIAILGVNSISRQLAHALASSGATNVEVVAYPLLCNLRMLDGDGTLNHDEWPSDVGVVEYSDWQPRAADADCLVVTSDFGGLDLIRRWNTYALRHDIHLLPVVLQDLMGYVGPLVIPHETPCYECLRVRENSHFQDAESQRAMEPCAAQTQSVAGFHPSMASILGDIAALELGRFYGRWAPPRVVGTLIEVNMLGPSMVTRPILKVPRCTACSPLMRTGTTNIRRDIFLPMNDVI